MGTIGWQQLLIVAIIFIVLFGAKKLPETAKGLATSLRVFKKEIASDDDQAKSDSADADTTTAQGEVESAGETKAAEATAESKAAESKPSTS